MCGRFAKYQTRTERAAFREMEFRSTPRDGHPLFTGFVKAARAYRQEQMPVAQSA